MFNSELKKKIEKEISKKINLEKNFQKNNLDSLDIITFISLIEDEYGIEIKESELKKIKNFKALFDIVRKKSEKKL